MPFVPTMPARTLAMGWTVPEPPALLPHLAQAEAEAPFDGLVLTLRNNNQRAGTQWTLGYNAWHARAERPDSYAQAVKALTTITATAQRYRHNLLDLKCQPGQADWFSDAAWTVCWHNCTLLAKLAHDTGCVGIFMDTEHYSGGTPFSFLPTTTTHRDSTKTFAEYQAKVRQRGQEYMQALQTAFPGLVVLLSMGYSNAYSVARQALSLAQSGYGLLPSFLDGMLDATTVPLYDGYEQGYGFLHASHYNSVLSQFLLGGPVWSLSLRYDDYYQPSFGLWLDYARRWDGTDLTKNYFSPLAWQATVRLAQRKTFGYVWLYAERPNWFDGTLPAGYRYTAPVVSFPAPSG